VSERELRVERDCIHAMYGQGLSGNAIAAMVAGMVVLAMWDSVPRAALLAWLAAYCANLLLRHGMIRAFRRENPEGERLRIWARRYTVGLAFGGTVFGSVAIFMFPYADPVGQTFLMICVIGMSAGGITGNAYYPPAMYGYALTLLLPMLFRLALAGGFEHALLAFAFGIYLAGILMFGRTQAALIRKSFAVGHENVDLLKKAEQASLAKSQFFAAASHDLRQPMQALGLYAASLRELKREPEDARKIDQILSSVDALESLFDELLDISRLDAGYVQPGRAHFPARLLFQRLESAYAPIARKSGLALELHPGDAVLYSDPVLLERVVGNLVSNGLRYTEAGGVTIACDPRGVISVEDTGIGIPRAEHEKVFDEFYQLENPERDRRKGLGLGLATVRRITTLLGHPLRLESEIGRGTRFTLEVPLGDPAAASERAPAPRGAELEPLVGRRVLVIEDEASVREGLVELLRDWRCDVVAVASASDVADPAPEAIIADYRLRGGSNGIGAIDEMRRRFGARLPAILVTGDTTPEIFAAAREHALPLLTKPVRAARLRAALTHLLNPPARLAGTDA
jgi:signal transduction histidine kinase